MRLFFLFGCIVALALAQGTCFRLLAHFVPEPCSVDEDCSDEGSLRCVQGSCVPTDRKGGSQIMEENYEDEERREGPLENEEETIEKDDQGDKQEQVPTVWGYGGRGVAVGRRGFVAGRRGFVGGRTGFVGGRTGFVGGRTGFVGGRTGFVGGRTGFVGGRTGFVGGRTGFVGGRTGFVGGRRVVAGRRW